MGTREEPSPATSGSSSSRASIIRKSRSNSKPPTAMMLIHSPTGFSSDFYVFKCVRTVLPPLCPKIAAGLTRP